jgi:uncharacterized protein (DUF1697 family)
LTPTLALLRAVNVAGTGTVAMAELRTMLHDLGFSRPRTLLQSGNLVFDAEAAPAALEAALEAELRCRTGFVTDVVVRDRAASEAVTAANPLAEEARRDPGHLLVHMLKAPPAAEAIVALRAAITGPERVALNGAELYAYYPEGVGRSKLTTALIERRLGVRGTGRNWNTVTKLAAMLAAS